PEHDRDPSCDPSGRYLAFRRGRGDLVLLDLGAEPGAPTRERVLVRGWDASLHWSWSPDGRHLAYASQDRSFNSDVFVIPVDGSAPAVNVSMHPNGDYAPAWSPDGKTLAFLSTRDGDEADVWQVHLDRRLDGMTPGESATYRELLGKLDRTPPSVAAVQSAAVAAPNTQLRPLDLDDAYLRLTRVTEWRGDEGDLALVPTGVVASQATEDGQRVLYHLDPKGERTELARSASLSDVSWS
ncbi:MAG: PD40 domain-containing protein, partial [Saprospiraceae bacterium]|nr:PD40 domain-containing protein [Saprospiraceae bacterium]